MCKKWFCYDPDSNVELEWMDSITVYRDDMGNLFFFVGDINNFVDKRPLEYLGTLIRWTFDDVLNTSNKDIVNNLGRNIR